MHEHPHTTTIDITVEDVVSSLCVRFFSPPQLRTPPQFALPRYNTLSDPLSFVFLSSLALLRRSSHPLIVVASSSFLPLRIHRLSSCSEPISQVTEVAFQEAETDMSGFGKLLLVAHLNAEEQEDGVGLNLDTYLCTNKAAPPVAVASSASQV